MKVLRLALAALFVLVAGPAWMVAAGGLRFDEHWYEADRSPAGVAPDPSADPRARVQVYAARAFAWRGVFAVHTWLATKPRGAARYTVHQVTRWNAGPVSVTGEPDRQWFGNPPRLLHELVGERAERAIEAVDAAVSAYPYAGRYRVWPGPNSNTFTAWVIRRVPELAIALPSTAIGKDYLGEGAWAAAPSGTGYQLSLGGLAGVLLARAEGLELNLLGLVVGLDVTAPALLLPGVGRVGFGQS